MQTEKLIELVKNRPVLYNQEDKMYSDVSKKEVAWKEIGKLLSEPAKKCKKQWNNLRDSYRRVLKKRRDSRGGQSANKIKKWKYEEEMYFLIPYIRERETSTHISDESNDELNTGNTNLVQKINKENSKVSMIYDVPTTEIIPKKQIKREPEAASVEHLNYVPNHKTKTQKEQEDTNEVELFFKSIASTVRKFSPYTQAVAKARVFSIISELELQELSNENCQHPPTYSSDSSHVPTPVSSPLELHSLHPQPNTSQYFDVQLNNAI